MPNDPLAQAIQVALNTTHSHLAERSPSAAKYRTSVAPFAAIEANTADSLAELTQLLAPGETTYLLGEKPTETPGLRWDGVVSCLQMLFPPYHPIPDARHAFVIEELSCANSAEMLGLIAIAYPGYFREETCRMGRYFGVREDDRLVAMGGERIVLEADGLTWREISGLCTHPEHTGRGYGTALLHYIIGKQRELGAMSWLHVVETNQHAIALYHRLGFQTLRRVELHRLTKDDAKPEAS